MARLAALAARFLILAAIAGPAAAQELPTAEDYRWLAQHLDIAKDDATVRGLTEAQRARLHALIAAPKIGDDKKRQDIVQFLVGATGEDLETTLHRAEQ
jgi:hypothetical protein